MALGSSTPPQAPQRPRLERVEALQERIRGMQSTRLESRALPTLASLSPVLPGGSLREGSVYTVEGSTSLLMAFLAGPSKAGAWCAVVGMPDFGAEAAARLGIELQRLVLVPDPGRQWLAVVAALIDVIPVVAVRPTGRVAPAEATRLDARLRQRDATLIVAGDWPGSDCQVGLIESRWTGLGWGHGNLIAREVLISSSGRAGFARAVEARLWLPDHEQRVRVTGQEGDGSQIDETSDLADARDTGRIVAVAG